MEAPPRSPPSTAATRGGIRSLLFRAHPRLAATQAGAYRLIPATAENGLLLRGDPRITGKAPFALAPQTETLALDGVEGELTYEFFRMRVGEG